MAAPSEKAYASVNDSPEATTFSWELTTTPINSTSNLEPTAQLTIDSTKANEAKLILLEDKLYGRNAEAATLPLPAEVITLLTPAGP